MSVFINRNGDSGCNQTVVACEVGQTQHCLGAEERESCLHKYGRREPRSQSYETREDSDLTSLPPPSCSLDEVGGGAGCASRPQRLRIQLGLCHQWPGLGLHWQALGATRQTQLSLISPHPSAWRRLPRPHAHHVGVLLISKNWKLNLLVQPWDPT